MARVNPPVQQVPEGIRDVSKELFEYLQNNQFNMFQLWTRTGGGSDNIFNNETNITNITNSETFETSNSTEEFLQQISNVEAADEQAIESKLFNVLIKNQNYTAVDMDFIEARSGIVITLDPNAQENDDVIIANGDSSRITVLGSVKIKRIETSVNINQAGTSLHFKKFPDYWRIV